MRRYDIPREKAVRLRENGHTLTEIVDMLGIPKSTVYGWIRSTEIQKPNAFLERTRRSNKVAARKAAQALRRKYRTIHDEHRSDAIDQWRSGLKDDERFKLFLMLYLTEGKRRCRGTVGFCNTNPALVKFGSEMLDLLNTNNHKITYSLLVRDNLDVGRAVCFWRAYLGITEITVYKRGGGGRLKGRNWCARYGVMTVIVCDSYLKTQIETWMSLFLEEQL